MTRYSHLRFAPEKIEETLDARIQNLASPPRCYRTAAHRFVSYLQTDFPQVRRLSQLRRDPHLLGWLRCLSEQDPPLSNSTRRIYLVVLRRLLHDLQPGLILPEDFPARPRKPRPTKDQPSSPLPPPPLPHPVFGEIFDGRIQVLKTTLRWQAVNTYRIAARRFLSYLQTTFPQVLRLSELRRDPHLLGWCRYLCEEDPPLSQGTRQQYLLKLRRLFRDLVSQGHPLQPGLILPEDFPTPPAATARSRLPHLRFGDILNDRIQTLATILRPSTTAQYRVVADRFLSYLQTDFPQLLDLSALRRNPHLTGWFRRLCEEDPPLCNRTRQQSLLQLRRLFDDLAAEGHALQPGLILREDFPPLPQHLPRALSPDQDRQLQQDLRRTDDLLSNALLLTRATGIRIGECIHLALDCLRPMGLNQWALHVPLGKLHTERLVPVDDDVRQIVTRILTLRAEAPPSHLAQSTRFLLPHADHCTLYQHLRLALNQAAARIGSADHITPHRLRHYAASRTMPRKSVPGPTDRPFGDHRCGIVGAFSKPQIWG